MLACGSVVVDLLEFVCGDLLTLKIIQLRHKPFVDKKGRIEKELINWNLTLLRFWRIKNQNYELLLLLTTEGCYPQSSCFYHKYFMMIMCSHV